MDDSFPSASAILFGLENIAECGWSAEGSIKGLVAHEIGHLAHHHWRAQDNVSLDSGPWWQLYEEGFAQRCEHVILGEDTWHESAGPQDDDWLSWYEGHRSWLAAEFLRMVDEGAPVRRFFGSWFELCGRKLCGYYLGHELVRELEAEASLRKIALLDDLEDRLRPMLEGMSATRETPETPTR